MLKRLTMSALAAAVLNAGCLQKDTSHTLYVAPDGSVSWVTSEAGVRSSESEPAKRLPEEQSYIGAALIGMHGVARGLAALRPESPVRTTVLRDERPFHVVTEARFAAVDRVLERVFSEMGIQTSASFVRGVDENTLRVRLDFAHPLEERETPVSQLMDNIEHLRIVLTEGELATVRGFDATDRTSAMLSAEWLALAEKAYETKSTIEFTLTWSVQ